MCKVIKGESQKQDAEARDLGKCKLIQLAENDSKSLEGMGEGFRQYRLLDDKRYGDVIEVLRQL